MKKSVFFLIFNLLFLTFSGCSLYRQKQKVCRVIYDDKLPLALKEIAVFPVEIGFPTAPADDFVPLLKSPLIVRNKSEDWTGSREEKMIIDYETAEKISSITSEHFYNILLKKKRYDRVVHPDSVRNVIVNKNIKIGDFKSIEDLNNPESLEKLFRITDGLKVDGLLISVIKKCETVIVSRDAKSTGRKNFGEYQKSMVYTYKFELETGIFTPAQRKIVWIGSDKETRSNSTPELEQNILVAFATNGVEKFFRKYLKEKILREEPEYRCALRIVNTMPF